MAEFQLIDLNSGTAFLFQFFPNEIRTSESVNWNPQDLTSGVKPLFYANAEPRSVSINELHIDTTDTERSLRPDLDDLRSLKTESEGKGTPPPLLAIWGSNKLRCVLKDLSYEEIYFNDDGDPTRVKINLELLELQEEGTATSVREVDTSGDHMW